MKILYTTDGFEASDQAGRLLEAIADRSRVEIAVMSVTHGGIPRLEHLPIVLDPRESRRADTTKIVDAAVDRFTSEGFKASGHTAEGHPGHEIIRAIEDGGHEIVVLGAGRRSWLGKRLLGSVSTHVLHSAPCSVLIVHEAAPVEGKVRVLLGTDDSPGATLSLETLVGIADPARIEVTVVSVAEPYSPTIFPVLGAAPIPIESSEQIDAVQQQINDLAQQAAENAAAELRAKDIAADVLVHSGHPIEQILREADEGGYALVVVGSRGHGPMRRAVLGSVSDQVVRHCRASLIGRHL